MPIIWIYYEANGRAILLLRLETLCRDARLVNLVPPELVYGRARMLCSRAVRLNSEEPHGCEPFDVLFPQVPSPTGTTASLLPLRLPLPFGGLFAVSHTRPDAGAKCDERGSKLILEDADWIPEGDGYSLYIRPTAVSSYVRKPVVVVHKRLLSLVG